MRYVWQHTMSHQNMQNILDQVYDFICDYFTQFGISPTQQEIAIGCYLSRTTLSRYLLTLELRGRIERQDNKPRSIRIMDGQCSPAEKGQ